MLPADGDPLVELKALEGPDGLQVVELPELDGFCLHAFVGFVGARPVGILTVAEPPDSTWPRLHQIEALASIAGHARLLITKHDGTAASASSPANPPLLLQANVRMRPTVEPTVEHWPGVGIGFQLLER